MSVGEPELQVAVLLDPVDDQIEIALTSGHQPGATFAMTERAFKDPGGVGAADRQSRMRPVTRSIAQRTFTSDATVDSLVTFDGKNFAATPRVTYRVVAPNVLKRVGEARLLPFTPAFLGPARNFRLLAQELESRGARRFPLDAGQILAPAVTITDIRITLPLGWKARRCEFP